MDLKKIRNLHLYLGCFAGLVGDGGRNHCAGCADFIVGFWQE